MKKLENEDTPQDDETSSSQVLMGSHMIADDSRREITQTHKLDLKSESNQIFSETVLMKSVKIPLSNTKIHPEMFAVTGNARIKNSLRV